MSFNEINTKILFSFWEKLLTLTQFTLDVSSQSQNMCYWKGKGIIDSVWEANDSPVIVFNEKGSWLINGKEINFSNCYRWTLNLNQCMISLDHLRYGSQSPVTLLNFSPTNKKNLSCLNPHFCGNDRYFGEMNYDESGLNLKWKVIGPKKNDELHYFYY